MKYLLDTHALIWFIEGNNQLSAHARRLMEDEANELFISVASLWEMAIRDVVPQSIRSQQHRYSEHFD